MKKLTKILCMVLVMVMVIAPVVSFASFSNVDGDSDTLGLVDPIQNVGNGVYTILKTIAIIVAVCMIAYMAIQWFIAAPAKKAELKGRMWSMAIGVVLLIGGVWILNTLETAVNSFTGM